MSLRALVVGPTGSGKSQLARRIAAAADDELQVLVIDEGNSWEDQGLTLLTVTEEMAEGQWDLTLWLRDNPRAVMDLSGLLEPAAWLEQVARAVLVLGNILVVVDEAQHFLPAHSPALQFLRLISEGRKRGVSIVVITQTLGVTAGAGLSPLLIRNLNTVMVMGGQREPRELERLTVLTGHPEVDLGGLNGPIDGTAPDYVVYDLARGKIEVTKGMRQ